MAAHPLCVSLTLLGKWVVGGEWWVVVVDMSKSRGIPDNISIHRQYSNKYSWPGLLLLVPAQESKASEPGKKLLCTVRVSHEQGEQ